MSGALVTLLWALSAVTKPTSAGTEPATVHIEYGNLQYKPKEKQTIFLGKPHVRVKRQDATLICHKLVANDDGKGRITTADCIGDVRLERGEQIVTCATATLDNVAGEVVCRGKPVVMRDGQSEAQGDKLIYNLESGMVEVTGNPGRGKYVPKEGDQILRRKKKAEGGQ